jgi:GPH family glycoside/pentoside/hexuronide:cation symporter
MGLALAWAGYITPESGAATPVQPSEAVGAIRFFMGPVPIVLLILAIAFAWRYPIGRGQHRALRDELAARQGEP